MKLAEKTILITGGAGFIGSHLVERCLKEKMNVKVIDNLFSGKKENLSNVINEIEFIKADIRNKKAVEKAVKDCDFILHEAALRSVRISVKKPFEYNSVNINGTLNILEAAKNNSIKRIVFASSSSVYGNQKMFPLKEDFNPKPESPYALTKIACEYYLHLYYDLFELPSISLRYFNVFGPRQDFKSEYAAVIPIFINKIMKNEKPEIFGDGKQSRDFTFISDVVEANIKALKAKKNALGETFNICNGKSISVNEVFRKIRKALNSNIKPKHTKAKLGDVKKTQGNPEKAKKILKFKCKISFDEGLKKTIEWLKELKKEKAKI